MANPGDTANVIGRGKEFIDGTYQFIDSDVVQAELVKPIGCGFWWVKFPGDTEKGKQVLRVRMVIS